MYGSYCIGGATASQVISGGWNGTERLRRINRELNKETKKNSNKSYKIVKKNQKIIDVPIPLNIIPPAIETPIK
jgi:hypothetical protein